MRRKILFCLVISAVVAFCSYNNSEAAHFSVTGTASINQSGGESMTQFQWCNYDQGNLNIITTIDPDGTESIGDPVAIDYCYSVIGATTTPDEGRYMSIAGVGDSSTFSVACLPSPTYTPSSSPATLILNPGPGQTIVASYGPQVITGNSNVSVINQCGIINAHIGDTLQGDGGTFLLLYDSVDTEVPNPASTASIGYTFDANIRSDPRMAVPTLTEWGMIIFMVFAGLGAVYHLRKRRGTES